MQDEMPSDAATAGAANDKTVYYPPKEPIPFSLPEYSVAFYRFVGHAIDQLIVAKNPILSKLRTVPSSDLHISRNTTPTGQLVENLPVAMSLQICLDLKDSMSGNLDAIAEGIDSAAEEGLRVLLPQLNDYMMRSNDAFGGVIHLERPQLDHKAITKFFDTVDLEFSDDGIPDLDSWLLVTDVWRKATAFPELMKMLPPRTDEESLEWNEMLDRKRRKFDAKRRRRTLS